MKTIVSEKSTKLVSDNVLIKIEEDGNTIYLSVNENRWSKEKVNSIDHVITNTLSIDKDGDLELELHVRVEEEG